MKNQWQSSKWRITLILIGNFFNKKVGGKSINTIQFNEIRTIVNVTKKSHKIICTSCSHLPASCMRKPKSRNVLPHRESYLWKRDWICRAEKAAMNRTWSRFDILYRCVSTHSVHISSRKHKRNKYFPSVSRRHFHRSTKHTHTKLT